MRLKEQKSRCVKRQLEKSDDICRTYDAIHYAGADYVNALPEVKSFRSVSKKLVMELLDLERGTVSIAEMDENGEQIGDGKAGIVTCFDNEMDYDTRKILDETFEQFSNLDIYILMKEFGLFGEEIRKQEMCDFVITTEFQKLLAEDMTIRSKSDPIKTAYNKKIKIKKVLASLAGKISMAELEGTLEAYVEEKWNRIVG